MSYRRAQAGVHVSLTNGQGAQGDAAGDVLRNFEAVQGSRFNDTFADAGSAVAYRGGEGLDRVDYSAATGSVHVDLDGGMGLAGAASGDSYSEIEAAIGTAFADTLIAGEAAHTLEGGAGSDLLVANGGGDLLRGGAGHDTYLFGFGSGAFVIEESEGVDVGMRGR